MKFSEDQRQTVCFTYDWNTLLFKCLCGSLKLYFVFAGKQWVWCYTKTPNGTSSGRTSKITMQSSTVRIISSSLLFKDLLHYLWQMWPVSSLKSSLISSSSHSDLINVTFKSKIITPLQSASLHTVRCSTTVSGVSGPHPKTSPVSASKGSLR